MAKKVAKKKKGARKAAPRPARKTARKTARKAAAPKPHLASTLDGKVTWQKSPNEVNLTPLKAIIKEHISELRGLPQTDDVRKMVTVLETASAELRSGCGLSMTFPRS